MAKKVRYTLTKKGSAYCTHNSDTGNDIHCFTTRAKALQQLKALYAAQGDPVGKDKAMMDRIECFEDDCDRSFLTFDTLGDHLEVVHQADMSDANSDAVAYLQKLRGGSSVEMNFAKMRGDSAAEVELVPCSKCDRHFLTEEAAADHADYVHTFEDIRGLVGEKVREKYAKPSTITSGSIYAWVQDLTNDTVYFQVEDATDCETYQASYSINGNDVTLGEPAPVVKRTVYVPAPSDGQAVQAEGY